MHRNFEGTIKSITVSRTTDNRYYISLLVEEETKPMEPTDKMIGLDLGLKELIVDSNGKKYKNHKYLTKSQAKLAKEQRKLSKMVKGSNNRNKQRIKVAKLHKHIQNQRNDYLHKLSKKIIDENHVAIGLLSITSLASCGAKNNDEKFTPSLDKEMSCDIKVVGDYSNFEALGQIDPPEKRRTLFLTENL